MRKASLSVLSYACLVVAAVVPRANTNSTAPCGMISTLAATQGRGAIVDAQLAFDCLNSVPLKAKEALQLMQAMMPFVELQSTIEYLKAPPASYWLPPIDLRANLNEIMANISSGSYSSEYAFQTQLLKVVNAVHDGHFRFYPDLVSKALLFERPTNTSLVSVSLDGKEWPKVYSKDDISRMSVDTEFKPSAVSKINGQDAGSFLQSQSLLNNNNDPDAAYNVLFYSPAFAAQAAGAGVAWKGYFGGSGVSTLIYPGPDTTLMFDNGTSWTVKNFARVSNFTGITDGESMYQKFCTGPTVVAQTTPVPISPMSNSTIPSMDPNTTSLTTPSVTTAPATPSPLVAGYPKPIIVTSDSDASGYYLANSNVAVLTFRSFEPDNPAEWQMATQKFLAAAKADGKTKLIVDLQSNGGGVIFTGYDTFRQLFPQIVQDGNTRFRNTEPFQELAVDVNMALPPGFDPKTSDNITLIQLSTTVTNFEFDLDINNKSFMSVEAKFAKNTFLGDVFTPIIRWDTDSPLITRNATFGVGMDITGYQSRQNFTQPFAAEDIVIIQDGFCASTCTIFSEFMRTQAGVKTIAMGGRTPQAGSLQVPIIQGVGGTRGPNNFAFDFVVELSQLTLDVLRDYGLTAMNETLLRSLANTLPSKRSMSASVNIRDNILKDNLDDGTPTQFIYEPADCRLFYTPAMMQNITAIWTAAASAAWGNTPCNAGSLNNGSTATNNTIFAARQQRRSVSERDTMTVSKEEMEALGISVGLPTKDRSLAWREANVARVPF